MANNIKQLEHKTLPFYGKAVKVGDSHYVEGFTAVFGNVDDGGDRLLQGAVAASLLRMGKRIKMGWQHDLYHPLGTTAEIREVGRTELPEELLTRCPDATGGLYVKGIVIPTATNLERLMLIEGGAVDELSIGYYTLKAVDVQDGMGWVRNLVEIELLEWSPVTLAMNAGAIITDAKNLQRDQMPTPEVKDWETRLSGALEVLSTEVNHEEKAGASISVATRACIQRAMDELASLMPVEDEGAGDKAGDVPEDKEVDDEQITEVKESPFNYAGAKISGWLASRGLLQSTT